MSRDLSVPLPVKHPLTHRAQVQVDLDVERVRHPSPLKENRWKCNHDSDADIVLQIPIRICPPIKRCVCLSLDSKESGSSYLRHVWDPKWRGQHLNCVEPAGWWTWVCWRRGSRRWRGRCTWPGGATSKPSASGCGTWKVQIVGDNSFHLWAYVQYHTQLEKKTRTDRPRPIISQEKNCKGPWFLAMECKMSAPAPTGHAPSFLPSSLTCAGCRWRSGVRRWARRSWGRRRTSTRAPSRRSTSPPSTGSLQNKHWTTGQSTTHSWLCLWYSKLPPRITVQ